MGLFWRKKGGKAMRQGKGLPEDPDVQISEKMAAAIHGWLLAFYQNPTWAAEGLRPTNMPVSMTGYMATLACSEIALSAGSSARGKWLEGQAARFILPLLHNAVQLAGAGGRVILKPFPAGRDILCEVVPADRIFPTRINGRGTTEAGFFTDFAALRGRRVVRVESFDLQPEGLYLQNRAYWYAAGEALGGELSLEEIPQWAGLAPDALIRGVDRPLFGELKMPFANTVDETSRLPVSLYARAMDGMEELDRLYNGFLYEMHSGRRKRIVDRDALLPKKGLFTEDAPFPGIPRRDLVTDLYLTLDMDSGGKPFDDYTPALRVDDYQKALDIQCRLLENQTGFSPGTFHFDVKAGRMTATQVISEDQTTYNTIKAIQERGLRQGLLDLLYSYDVYATLYRLAPSGAAEFAVSFGDGIFEDTGTEFTRRKLLADSGYLKPEKLISWYFGVPEEAAADYMPAARKSDEAWMGFGGEG
nr:MAG TPA: portal protein [Caudoviricetes sp.]